MTRRASVSLRRDSAVHSPGVRARSQERSIRNLEFETNARRHTPDSPSVSDLEDDERNLEMLNEALVADEQEEEEKTKVAYLRDGAYHHRAMSDPLDAAEDEGSSGFLEPHVLEEEGLPTLPRFPVATSRDLNCWSEPLVDIFHVRGPHYLDNKKKIVSGPYLLRARGCDMLLADPSGDGSERLNVGRNPNIFSGSLRKVPTFLINFSFPWGVLLFYFEIPDKLCPFLRANPPTMMDDLTPAEQTLAKFFMGDTKYRNDRLKLIPYVAAGPWIVRNMVTGKPAIIGRKLPVSYTYEPPDSQAGLCEYLEADLDIGSSSKAAKRIVSVCRRYVNSLTADIGFVIQGNTTEELPEQMMGSIRIHGVDPLKAPTLCQKTDSEERECFGY